MMSEQNKIIITRALREHKLRQGRCTVALWWVTIYRVKCKSPNVKESEKLIIYRSTPESGSAPKFNQF